MNDLLFPVGEGCRLSKPTSLTTNGPGLRPAPSVPLHSIQRSESRRNAPAPLGRPDPRPIGFNRLHHLHIPQSRSLLRLLGAYSVQFQSVWNMPPRQSLLL